jgi:hypothetical protein
MILLISFYIAKKNKTMKCQSTDEGGFVQHGVYLIALSLLRGLFKHLRTDFAAAGFFQHSLRRRGSPKLETKVLRKMFLIRKIF